MNSGINIGEYNKIIESIYLKFENIVKSHSININNFQINRFNIIKFINNLKYIFISKNLENNIYKI